MLRPLQLIRSAAIGALLLPAVLLAQPLAASPLANSSASAAADLWLTAMLLMMGVTTALMAYLCPLERRLPYLSGMLLSAVAWAQLRELGPAVEVACLALLAFCALRFILRPLIALPTWLAVALRAQLVVAPLSVWLLEAGQMPGADRLWAAVLTLELLWVMATYTKLHRKAVVPAEEPLFARPQDPLLLQALLTLSTLAVLALLALRLVPGPAAAAGPILVKQGLLWAAALLQLAMGLQATAALARARRLAEARQAQAEQDMHSRVAEVELSFGTLVEQKLEQVTERERKRIAADLHDDLGAKLLTIVHTSESDRISTLAREALEEMRLSVRGLTGKPVQLLDALGDWRAEVVSRLGQANIQAEWESPAEDIIHTLPARAYVQTTRIFREAVSNIIKHSGGSHCNISCKVQDGDFLIVIQDNGQGIPAELDGRLDRGHGMASMKSRAKQMHGQCLVESGPGWGTVIRLTIPL
nr:ATP-binding protein [Roseateles sp.]